MHNIYDHATCSISRAELNSFDGKKRIDITNMITEILIHQSLEMTNFRGYLQIFDTIGLLEDFPLRGEEHIYMELISEDLKTEKKLNLQIFKIDNINVKEGNDGVSYKIHFVSRLSFLASLKRIIEPYEQTIDTIAKSVFSKYFSPLGKPKSSLPYGTLKYPLESEKTKSFYVQPTEGIFRCIIPDYTPSEAMYFLFSRAYSSESPSCSFRFFETLDAYYFVTDEFLIEKTNDAKRLTYNVFVDKSPAAYSEHITNLTNLEYARRVDIQNDVYSGGYRNVAYEIDFLKKRVQKREYTFDKNEKYTKTDKRNAQHIHSDEFLNTVFTPQNQRRFMIFKDYSSVGDLPGQIRGEEFLSEIASNRTAYQHHLQNTMLNATIDGRLDLAPGDLIFLDIHEFTAADTKKRNPQIYGNYLIQSTSHVIQHDRLTTALQLVKFDWNKA